MAFASRATIGEHSNKENILKTITLRKQRAQLLGFKTHADYVLQDRMAETPERVSQFLEDLYSHAYEPSFSRVQFSKICEGSSTKSQ